MESTDLNYGPAYVIDGEEKGRIGYFDDDHTIFEDDEEASQFSDAPGWRDSEGLDEVVKCLEVAIVYFGDYFLAEDYAYIPYAYLRSVTTDDLFKRREEITKTQGLFASDDNVELEQDKKFEYYRELHYLESVLVDRMVEVRYSNRTSGSNVFISHSSKDKKIAKWIATDLKAAGHTPWLDEWAINIGESIPQKISQGLEDSAFVVVILSEHAVSSNWVEKEWQSKYWDEVSNNTIHVLPILFEECTIPELLKTKRYADFRSNYNNGLEDLLLAIDNLSLDNENS